MTDIEKGVMVRLCAKILAETDLYEADAEVRDLIDWVCVSGQMKENNNKIRSLTGEYKQIEPECRKGIREKMEYNDIPESFKGMPIVLVTAGLMAIAFCGFSGLL